MAYDFGAEETYSDHFYTPVYIVATTTNPTFSSMASTPYKTVSIIDMQQGLTDGYRKVLDLKFNINATLLLTSIQGVEAAAMVHIDARDGAGTWATNYQSIVVSPIAAIDLLRLHPEFGKDDISRFDIELQGVNAPVQRVEPSEIGKMLDTTYSRFIVTFDIRGIIEYKDDNRMVLDVVVTKILFEY